jgi:hypothetical protein
LQALGFERADSAQALRGFNRKLPSVGVGEIFGKENLGYVLAGDTTGCHNLFGKSRIAGLSVVCHTVKLSKERWSS